MDLKHIAGSTKRYTLEPDVSEVGDNNFLLKYLLPKEVKVNITFDDNGLKSNLTTTKTIRFIKNSFFYTILGFVQSHSGVLGENDGFVQLISGT